MEKTDLRVTKTIRAIKQAFMNQICTKPINKITVVDLTKEAEINKGTFYLHYSDIYQLYDEMVVEIAIGVSNKFFPYPDLFTSLEEFARAVMSSEKEPPNKAALAILKEDNLKFSASYPHCFVDTIRMKIYEVGKLVPCQENDIKIEFILNGMVSILSRPGLIDSSDPECIEFVVQYLSVIVQNTFPELYLSLD